MSNTPFMPLWVADFVGDTLDLDAKEVGAYMLILMTMWGRDGTLPNDQKKLQRVARCGRDWPKVWDAIGHYFTVEGDTITQGRLRKELQKAASKREVNAQSGARGGRAKALKSKNMAVANATVSLQQPEPDKISTLDTVVSKDAGASVDPSKMAFDSGIKLLMAAGKSRDAAGAMVAKWRREYGAGPLIDALGAAYREGAIQPIPFVEACLRKSGKLATPQIGQRRKTKDGQEQEFCGFDGWMTVRG